MSTSQTNYRHRKQRFPRSDRRRTIPHANHIAPIDEQDSDDDSILLSKRQKPFITNLPTVSNQTKPQSKDASRLDKRARDEHNEQERSRRRELAVIYELIRCSFSNDDLRYLGYCNGPKSVDKLSYPQVLQVAYHLIREEQHNLILFEKSLNDIKIIEKEFAKAGLPIPERPSYPTVKENYRKIVEVVDNLLKQDKSARSAEGVYEITPAERAAIGNQELSFLRSRGNRYSRYDSNFSDYENMYDREHLQFPYEFHTEREDMRGCYSPSSSTSTKLVNRRSSTISLENRDDIDTNIMSLSPPIVSDGFNYYSPDEFKVEETSVLDISDNFIN